MADSGMPALQEIRLRDGRCLAEACAGIFRSLPLKVKRLGTGSNDCSAWKLELGDRTVKCYECESPGRADLVGQATRLLEGQGVPIPEILAVTGHVVFATWTRGMPLVDKVQKGLTRRMSAYQARLHAARLPAEPARTTDFVHLQWLLHRLRKGCAGRIAPERVDRLIRRLLELQPPHLKPGVVHPDFITPNLVVTASDETTIVDNEFLGIGTGHEFDILNTAMETFPDSEASRDSYFSAYSDAGDLGTLVTDRPFWDLCYLAKMAGKHFVAGNLSLAQDVFARLERRTHSHAYTGGDRNPRSAVG